MSTDEQFGTSPIEPGLRELMNQMAAALNDTLNPPRHDNEEKSWGFVLLVFPFEDHGGFCNYISNAKAEDIKVLLREQLAQLEGRVSDVKGHG